MTALRPERGFDPPSLPGRRPLALSGHCTSGGSRPSRSLLLVLGASADVLEKDVRDLPGGGLVADHRAVQGCQLWAPGVAVPEGQHPHTLDVLATGDLRRARTSEDQDRYDVHPARKATQALNDLERTLKRMGR
ncbi:hypothetical protein [uncultured Pseudokineococcus sp.]|uniref:hypothetical protein n=1 Tax=uncultured Pseudokineococcus sp. TaxID=1642928 RepID=UPI002624EEC8|nr:hypothetical protein [uncultured Pseudokineococcus sp.]